ncbi:hypothetical protein [Oscillibacter sp.]|nr:hypothetical protein [Oscillibacter sp.]
MFRIFENEWRISAGDLIYVRYFSMAHGWNAGHYPWTHWTVLF